jgi:sec-independent protein translocase protein TatC
MGMLLTPPDIISQTMLAVPMLLLFEVGVIIASFYYREEEKKEEELESEIKEK